MNSINDNLMFAAICEPLPIEQTLVIYYACQGRSLRKRLTVD